MQKTKSLQNIERQMGELDPASFRYRVLDAARGFKSSWIDLGQLLYSVSKDKKYKDWGFLTFEAYCEKEVGIKQATAVKMLKSYYFLESEEPAFLKEASSEERTPAQIPGFESVNALRLAKESERLTPKQYEDLREDVMDGKKEEGELKKKIRYVLKSTGPNRSAEDEASERKTATVKRLLSNLNGAKTQINELDFPPKVLKQIDVLIELLTDYLK